MGRFLGLLLIITMLASSAWAQTDLSTSFDMPVLGQVADINPLDAVSDDDVNAVARHLFCPVCESEPLNTCLAPTCFEWRSEIRRQLSEGRTQQEIIDYFVSEAGQHVVGLPQDQGLRLLSIGGPIVMGLITLAVGLVTIRRWRKNSPAVVQTTGLMDDAIDDDYRARLERDLNDL